MSKRHSDALFIQEGACNPIAIANSLVAAMKEVREESMAPVANDPAVLLIAHQLSFILGLSALDDILVYDNARSACKEAAKQSGHRIP